jgi:hypothetical protein
MRTPGGTQRADPFRYGCAGWGLLGQQPPVGLQLTRERKLERLAGVRCHEPSVVVGAVIVGELLGGKHRERVVQLDRVGMRECTGCVAHLGVLGRPGAARRLSRACVTALGFALALGADGFTVAPPAAAEIAMTMSWAPLTLRRLPRWLRNKAGLSLAPGQPSFTSEKERSLKSCVSGSPRPRDHPRPVKSRGELRALALAQAPLRSGEEAFDRVSQRRRGSGLPVGGKASRARTAPSSQGNSVFRRSSASLSAPARTLRLSLTSPTQGDKTP